MMESTNSRIHISREALISEIFHITHNHMHRSTAFKTPLHAHTFASLFLSSSLKESRLGMDMNTTIFGLSPYNASAPSILHEPYTPPVATPVCTTTGFPGKGQKQCDSATRCPIHVQNVKLETVLPPQGTQERLEEKELREHEERRALLDDIRAGLLHIIRNLLILQVILYLIYRRIR